MINRINSTISDPGEPVWRISAVVSWSPSCTWGAINSSEARIFREGWRLPAPTVSDVVNCPLKRRISAMKSAPCGLGLDTISVVKGARTVES